MAPDWVRLNLCSSASHVASAANALVRPNAWQKGKILILRWCTFLRLLASRHPPKTGHLPSSEDSPSFPPAINPSAASCLPAPLSGCSCLSWLPRGSLSLFRQDLSSSVKLQSSYHSVGCLERLTMTQQAPQTFHRSLPSTSPPH